MCSLPWLPVLLHVLMSLWVKCLHHTSGYEEFGMSRRRVSMGTRGWRLQEVRLRKAEM